MRYVAGVDVGSTQTKAVILNERREMVGRALLDMETSMAGVAQQAFDAALADARIGRDDVAYVVGTGYGRYKVTFGDDQVTEISCHARGAIELFPGTRTVLDIGGQDTKAIRIGPEGQVLDFRTRQLGIAFRVRMDVGKPDPPRLLPLRVQMPFGIVNDERITLASLDPGHTRVTLN
jgi:predicted CoA-substrate-specific enzyme activase